MSKIVVVVAACAAMVASVGCSSVRTAGTKDMNGMKLTTGVSQDIAHVNVKNSGLYLLSVPIFSGTIDKPGSTSFNKDTVKLRHVTRFLTARCQEIGATRAVDMTSEVSSTMIPLPIPFLFYWESIEMSANAVR